MRVMSKGIGKIFEAEIKGSFPEDYFVERYKDDTAGFRGVSNPADFRLYRYPYTFLFELKTHKGKSLPLDKIRKSQLEQLEKAVEHMGVYGGYIINFRDLEETYFVSVGAVRGFINAGLRKSIPVEYCRETGILIAQWKKRTRYGYNLDKLLRILSTGRVIHE